MATVMKAEVMVVVAMVAMVAVSIHHCINQRALESFFYISKISAYF